MRSVQNEMVVGPTTDLSASSNDSYSTSKVKARLVELGCTVLGGPPAAFGRLIADETEKWAKVIRFAGLKAE